MAIGRFCAAETGSGEKGAHPLGYRTQRLADVEAGRIVLSVSSFCQHKTTAGPSIFSFFPEIFLFSPLTAQRSGCEWRRRSSGVNELCRLRSERTIRSLRRRAKKKDRKKAIDLGFVESRRAEFANSGLRKVGCDPTYGRMKASGPTR